MEMEREMVTPAMERCDGNVTRAAKLLRVTRDTLVHKLEKLGLYKLTCRSK